MNNTNQKILVAEDDRFLSKVVVNKLKRNGYDAIAATDGVEAVKLAKEKKPDLILLDLVMPNKDGFEALEEIKADPETKNIPVVIMSNLGQGGDIKKGKELGAIDYLIKSDHGINEILEKVKEVLGEK